MRRTLCLTLSVLFSHSVANAAEKPSIEELTPLVEQYLYLHGRQYRFAVDIVELEGLWESFELQLLEVHVRDMTPFGHIPYEKICLLYYDGILESLIYRDVNSTLTSAGFDEEQLPLINPYELWLSGIPAETINRLTVEDGVPSIIPWEGGARQSLFVTKAVGCVTVQFGDFEKFNSWTDEGAVDWLRVGTPGLKFGLIQNHPYLVMVGESGEKIEDPLAYFEQLRLSGSIQYLNAQPRWSTTRPPGIVLEEGNSDKAVTRFSIEPPAMFKLPPPSLMNAGDSLSAIYGIEECSPKNFSQPIGEFKPHECWVNLAGDERDHFAALFSIRE